MAEVIIHLWKWFSVHSQTPFRHSWSHLTDNNRVYLRASLHSVWEPIGTKCPQALSAITVYSVLPSIKEILPCSAFLLLCNPTRLSFFLFSSFLSSVEEETHNRFKTTIWLGHQKPSWKHSQIDFNTFLCSWKRAPNTSSQEMGWCEELKKEKKTHIAQTAVTMMSGEDKYSECKES